uniref:Iron-sulfur cluster assembly enzyme a n=1 Tax=Oncorhynchus kisutch TaxID=8019 RepID=A0A8C7LTS7_ONCKI
PIPYHAVGFASQSAIFKKTRQSLQSCRDGQHEGLVVDHYENPINVGSLDKNAKNVGTGLVVMCNLDEKGKIVDASVTTFGCGSAIASSSLVTEWVKCKSIDEALKIKNSMLAQDFISPSVIHLHLVLAEDAIKAALADYRVKQKETRW